MFLLSMALVLFELALTRLFGVVLFASYAHLALGKVHMWNRRHEEAIAAHERTVELDPNFAVAYAGLGLTLHYAGRQEEAIRLVERGMRLDPHYPDARLHWLAQPHFQLGLQRK